MTIVSLVNQPAPDPDGGYVEVHAHTFELVCRDLEQDRDEAYRNGQNVLAVEKDQLLKLLGWDPS